MAWPLAKLDVINDALGLTCNTLCNVEDDGSDEWTVASLAYEAAITYMIESGNWKFSTVVAVLASTGVAPTDPLFDTAYAKPPALLHLIWVRINDAPVTYQILTNQIVMNVTAAGFSATNPGVVTAKYVTQPTPDQVTPTFMMALRSFVMSGIYRGLHEDNGEAEKLWMAGEAFLRKAMSRSDQEAPKRSFFNHRITAARRIRRPWPPVADEWGGSGTPG